jgi:hypothetical protein
MEDNNTEIRKICKACGVLKLLVKHFRKHPTCAGGYYPRCKTCIASKNMIYSEKNNKSGINDFLGMTGANKQTYIDMYLFLQQIGYDISKPVAEQFAKKHNLEVKERRANNLNKYTPESLGLI